MSGVFVYHFLCLFFLICVVIFVLNTIGLGTIKNAPLQIVLDKSFYARQRNKMYWGTLVDDNAA